MVFRQQPDRLCPGCAFATQESAARCERCGYGLRPRVEGVQRPARSLFGFGDTPPEVTRLSREYRCSHCRSFGAKVRRLNHLTSGELRHIGVNAAATCEFCGATQLFDLSVFASSPGVRWDILDE